MYDIIKLPYQPRNVADFYIYENFLDDNAISRVDRLLENLEYESGTVGSNVVKDSYRRSNLKWIPLTSSSEWLYNAYMNAALDSNGNVWNFSLDSFKDPIQYTEYDYSVKGHYDYHLDVGNLPPSCYRKLSLVVQLSHPDEYKGGDLILKLGKEETVIKRKKGLCVVFPSYFLHKVCPVTSGLRRSLVTWISGPPFK